LVELDRNLFELKRAVAHLDLGLKAYRAAAMDEIDASRLLEPMRDQVARLIDTADEMRATIDAALAAPLSAET
jgi:hypothetical protein